jgi:hypothetical protein
VKYFTIAAFKLRKLLPFVSSYFCLLFGFKYSPHPL